MTTVRFAFSLSRIYRHFVGNPFAIISAYLYEDPDNEERAARMKQAVRDLGLGYREIKGHWIEPEGEHAGEDSIEYSLFIPGIDYQDALWLAQGGYYDRKPQYSFIHSDGQDVAEYVTRTEQPKQKFENFEANDLNRVWNYYSEYRGRKFRFSSVEIDMAVPPPENPQGILERKAAYYDREDEPHEYGWRRPTALRTAVVSRRRRIEAKTQNGMVTYWVIRPHDRVIIERPADRRPHHVSPRFRSSKVAKWNPARFRVTYKLPARTQDLWAINPKNLLLSRGEYDGTPLERISWHPLSGEMLLSGKDESYHAHDIHNQGSYPFDEYVRAIVLPGKRRVVVRPWWPYSQTEMLRLDPGESDIISFEAQDKLRQVLVSAGMPKSWTFEFDGDNPRLERLTGRRDW